MNRYVIIDEDLMPLKKQEWQRDVTMAAYFSILQENSSEQKVKTIDFADIEKIFCGIGVQEYLIKKRRLPLTSVCIMLSLFYL